MSPRDAYRRGRRPASRRALAALFVLAVLLAACTSHDADLPKLKGPFPPTTPSTTAPIPLTSPQELKFPRDPGEPGAPLPKHCLHDPKPSSDAVRCDDFTAMDYDGWGNATEPNERFHWATDPAGSARVVTKVEVYGNDNADHFGSTRSELWNTPHDIGVNQEAWFAWGWYFPTDWQPPDSWMVLFQMHEASGTNPPQALEIARDGSLEFWVQTKPLTQRTLYPVPGQQHVTLGHWHYFLLHVVFSNTHKGSVEAWHSLDVAPDPSSAPLLSVHDINTLYKSGQGFAKVGLYRGASSASQHQIAYLWGYARAATAKRAIELSGLPAASGH